MSIIILLEIYFLLLIFRLSVNIINIKMAVTPQEEMFLFQKELAPHWEMLMETLLEGVVLLDPKGVIMAVNSSLEAITGYTRQELLGQTCARVRTDDCFGFGEEPSNKVCRLFQEGGISSSNCVLVGKDGTLRHIRKRAALILDDDQRVLGALETFLDISKVAAQERLILRLQRELRQEEGYQGILGKSPPMLRLFSLIAAAARTEAPVIIYGESGTGKKLVAQAIHCLGARKQGPFIRVNCQAMPEAVLNRELFGPSRGVLHDGDHTGLGQFAAAAGGDLFLEEVGDLPPTIQAKLLRAIREKTIHLGQGQQSHSVDVRLITATSPHLQQRVAEGRFREDLFHRLNVFPIHVPPLRERRDDLPLLAAAFLERACLRSNKAITTLSRQSLELLAEYPWPGNVRELINALEFAVLVCPGGEILPEHLPAHLSFSRGGRLHGEAGNSQVARKDKEALLRVLQEADGKKGEAARILGISRVTLWKWLKHYKINSDELRPAK